MRRCNHKLIISRFNGEGNSDPAIDQNLQKMEMDVYYQDKELKENLDAYMKHSRRVAKAPRPRVDRSIGAGATRNPDYYSPMSVEAVKQRKDEGAEHLINDWPWFRGR